MNSRRELSIDVDKHGTILKNNQNSRQTYVHPYQSKGLDEGFPLMWLNKGTS